MSTESRNLRQLCIALAAMALGMLLAWSQLALRANAPMPTSVAAKVGNAVVSADDFQRAVAATESARRTPLSAAQRRAVLNTLIEEQLLLQHGERLGLVYSDPQVRKPLVQSVLGLVRANINTPEQDEAKQWHQENRELFQLPEKFRVRVYLFPTAVVAAGAYKQLKTRPLSDGEYQQYLLSYIPDTLLPRSKLLDYVGDGGLSAIGENPRPGVLGPLPLMGKPALIELVEYRPPAAMQYAKIEEQVANAVVRERGEQALIALVDKLRAEFGVEINSALVGE